VTEHNLKSVNPLSYYDDRGISAMSGDVIYFKVCKLNSW